MITSTKFNDPKHYQSIFNGMSDMSVPSDAVFALKADEKIVHNNIAFNTASIEQLLDFIDSTDIAIVEEVARSKYLTSLQILEFIGLRGINVKRHRLRKRILKLMRLRIIQENEIVIPNTLCGIKYYELDVKGYQIARAQGVCFHKGNGYLSFNKRKQLGIEISPLDIKKVLVGNQIVLGLMINHAKIQRFGILETSRFVMVVDSNGKNLSDVSDFLSNYLENNDFFVVTDDQRHVVIKTCDQAIGDYSSCAEYAEYLTLSAFEETGLRLKIGVGGIVDALDKVHVSYSQAISTLDMMDVLQAEGDVHTYKEYVLIKILGDMPKTKLNQYLNLLLDESSKDVLSDEEIISTAEAFLNNNLNASETSRKMYLHRNTLSYRLDKIEKATGLNIRSFSDAVTFRLITILSKLTR